MPQAPYIPASDAEFDLWLNNWRTLATAAPATYGLTAADATAATNAYNSWHAAFLLATDPATRTSVTVAAKDAERVNAEQIMRPLSISVRNNASVANSDKVALGVNIPNTTPVPIPAPTSFPIIGIRSLTPLVALLQYTDSDAPSGKAKPYGVIGCEIARSIGTVAATDPSQLDYVGTVTKSPFRQTFVTGEVGKICSLAGRWVTRSGPGGQAQAGPWSAIITFVVV